ncbi:hypothetical protein KKD49_13425 [Myxococcota bacterium]|nr:hypothetical protein [Myxococcota bacterium]
MSTSPSSSIKISRRLILLSSALALAGISSKRKYRIYQQIPLKYLCEKDMAPCPKLAG